jgi:Leucine-rich repeat (LRR) protein
VSAFSHKPAKKRPYPSTPAQKIARRMGVAKKTGRLDLSTEVLIMVTGDAPNGQVDGNDSVAQSSLSGSHSQTQIQKWKEPEMPSKPGAGASTDSSFKRQTVEYALEYIPTETFTIKGLSELWLCNNPLKTISPKLAELDTLIVLSLVNVGLEEVPLEVSGLINLKRLYLQKNLLTSIPDDMCSVSQLTDLNISRNKFVGDIPAVVLGFKDLAYLDLSFNRFGAIPTTIMQLKTLSLLNVSENGIAEVPSAIPRRMPSMLIIGLDTGAQAKKYWSPESYDISKEDEMELTAFIKNRAAANNKKKETKERAENSRKPTN